MGESGPLSFDWALYELNYYLLQLFNLEAPAAFGLVTFLMVEGLEKMRIRRHLLFFSLAAPVMAVITYMGIAQVSWHFIFC